MVSQPLSLRNTFARLINKKQLKVIVVGNSVTNGAPIDKDRERNPSFYVTLENWLRDHFPEARIEVIPKIIFAMGPEVQLFRMDERVLPDKPDLVLAEFNAANGAAHGSLDVESPWRAITEPATEGFLRRLRFLLPETDCILEMAIFKTMVDDYRAGRTPVCASFQHKLAAHYGLLYADAAAEVARRILAGEPWETYMDDGIHPSVKGYEVYGHVLAEELDRQWALLQALPEEERVIKPHPFPAKTVHPDPWLFARFVPAYDAQTVEGFRIEQSGNVTFLSANQAGSSGCYRVPAPGRIVGMLMRYTDSCGNIEVRAGRKWIRISHRKDPKFTYGEDPMNRFYRVMFGVHGLPLALDTCEFRVSAEPETAGACRVEIAGFMVVERPAAFDFSRP